MCGRQSWTQAFFPVAAAIVFLALSFPVRAEPVLVRAAAHDGYGRIVFNWDFPVAFTARAEGRKLTVRFNRPIEADFRSVIEEVSRYVRDVTSDPDGHSVIFSLAKGYEAATFDIGSAIVVDIRKKTARPTSTEPAAERPILRMRTGEHENYTRVVFDWPQKVGYEVTKSARAATIVFASGARLDLNRINADPPNWIRRARTEMKGARLAVVFDVDPGGGVRHFYSGAKVVLDILRPDSKRVLDQKRAAASSVSALKEGAPNQPITLAPPNRAEQELRPPDPSLTSAASAFPSAVTLRFDWQEPVAAAVFRRAGALWFAFDKAVAFDPNLIVRAGGNVIRTARQLPSDNGTVLRMQTAAGINPTIRRDGLAWLFELRRQPLEPATLIEAKADPDFPTGARIFMPVPEPGRAIAVKDPEVGDNLVIIPVIPLGHGVAQAYDYPQVRILPSSQGIALHPWIDRLRVRSLRWGIELTSDEELKISPVSQVAVAEAKLGESSDISRVFDPDKWRYSDIKTYQHFKQVFQNAAAQAPKGVLRDKARFSLAQFFFSYGFAAEMLGVLNVIESEQPQVLNKPGFRALRGAANFLMARYADARDDLSYESLAKNDEAAFWLAAVDAAEGNLLRASSRLERMGSLISSYPRALKFPIGVLIAEAAIEAGNAKQAARYLDALQASGPAKAWTGQIKYLEGRLKELEGSSNKAIAIWEDVQKNSRRPTRTKASLARAELLYKLKKINTAEMIEELEKLRFDWRGDNFEFDLLWRLGNLYLEAGDYGKGLRTLKQAATYYRAHPKAAQITQKMADTFSTLYLKGKASDMNPVSAIALYNEFKELTPTGPKGDEMIHKLAGRLVDVDLLDRAAALLETQVAFRLSGEQKARVGTRLALVYLMSGKPKDAMKTLERSKIKNLPPELIPSRRRLRARALQELGRSKKALELLEDDKSKEAEQLRADIFWKSKNWPNASRSLRNLLRILDAGPGKPLNEDLARHVLNLAVTLALGADERGLERLRRNYGAAMETTALKDAFRLIATPKSRGLIDYNSIASRVSDAASFPSFLSSYKERLKGQGSEAAN